MHNPERPWRGVFTIPCTPFTDTGALDLDSLASEIDFCVRAGAHGLVVPVLASEAWTLTPDERGRVIRESIAGAGGRIPVVVGVSAETVALSLRLAVDAEVAGADAVIAIAPLECGGEEDQVGRSTAPCPIPLLCRFSSRMSIRPMARGSTRSSSRSWCGRFPGRLGKEETSPPGWAMTAEIEAAGPRLRA